MRQNKVRDFLKVNVIENFDVALNFDNDTWCCKKNLALSEKESARFLMDKI
jgi:hypothetical protein